MLRIVAGADLSDVGDMRAANRSQSAATRQHAMIVGKQRMPTVLPPDWVHEEAPDR